MSFLSFFHQAVMKRSLSHPYRASPACPCAHPLALLQERRNSGPISVSCLICYTMPGMGCFYCSHFSREGIAIAYVFQIPRNNCFLRNDVMPALGNRITTAPPVRTCTQICIKRSGVAYWQHLRTYYDDCASQQTANDTSLDHEG